MATLGGGGSGGADSTTGVIFGGSKIVTIAPIISLTCSASGGSSQVYGTFRKTGETSGYQVPPGKRFVAIAARAAVSGAAATLCNIGSSTNDVGFYSSSAPSNFYSTSIIFIRSTGPNFETWSGVLSFPAGTYVSGLLNAVASVNVYGVLFGYEIDEDAESLLPS